MSEIATILARLRSDWEVFDAPDGERGLRRREWADVASARHEAADLIESLQTALTEANKLLEQTIEVLEAYQYVDGWWGLRGLPLLDNLKALKKEAEPHG